MNKALFLDRDGTINVDKGYIYKIEDFDFIDGVIDFCQQAQKKDYKIIVITNQSGIARGYYTEKDYQKLTNYMCSEFKKQGVIITDTFFCPELTGPDRKPNAGLFLKAKEKYNLDMKQCISVGDKERDIQAGLSAGIKKNFLFCATVEKTLATKKFSSFKELESFS